MLTAVIELVAAVAETILNVLFNVKFQPKNPTLKVIYKVFRYLAILICLGFAVWCLTFLGK